MDFSEKVVREAWNREGGTNTCFCSCEKREHGHKTIDNGRRTYRCPHTLVWNNQNLKIESGWVAYHRDMDSRNIYTSNCGILCWPCYEAILSQQ